MAARVLLTSMLLVYLGLFLSLLYFHVGPTTVYSINWLGERNFTPEEWQHLIQHRIQRTRAASEAWLRAERAAQRERDGWSSRTRSRCPPFLKWRAEVPCDRRSFPPNATRIETSNFQKYNDSFLLPHYDVLGKWTVSKTSPTYWAVDIPPDPRLQAGLFCAEAWLNFSNVFDPIGSLENGILREISARTRHMSIRQRIQDATFRSYLTAVLTRQAVWLEGTRLSPARIAKVVSGFKPSNVSKPEQGVIQSFAKGLQIAFEKLIPQGIQAWKFNDLSMIHGEVCKAEKPPLLGTPRYGTYNVPYGLTIPNSLGYEVPYLTDLFTHWLHFVSNSKCSSPILFALDSFLIFYHIHPFMDCNTRVSQILMNAILMSYDLPPIQLLLFLNKKELRALQDQAAKGLRDGFYRTMLQQINESAEFILQYDYIRSM